MFHPVDITLTQSQFDKLRRGHTIQLDREQASGGPHRLMVHHETAKKIHRARASNKGVRIALTPHEMEMSGEGFKEFLEGLRNAGKWVKEKIIDTPFYQSSIKPIVRQAVDTGLSAVAPKLGVAAPLAKSGVDELGRQIGAFGVVPKKMRKSKGGMVKAQMVPMPQPCVDNAYIWPQPIPNLVNWGVGAQPVKKRKPAQKQAKGFKPA
jgi:hypothetical protein